MNRYFGRLNLTLRPGREAGLEVPPPPRAIELLKAWGPAAAWAAVLFLLSAQTDTGSSTLPLNDKVAHLVLYAVLGLTLAHGRRAGAPAPPHWLLLIAGSLYGVTDELHQAWVPGRDPSVGDWIADTVGVIAGYALAVAFLTRRRLDMSDA